MNHPRTAWTCRDRIVLGAVLLWGLGAGCCNLQACGAGNEERQVETDAGTGGEDGGVDPVSTPVIFNEIDVHGRDWVELVNPSERSVSLAGWVLSDDPDEEGHRYPLPAGTVLSPVGRLVIKAEKEEGDGKGFPFGLSSGDELLLLTLGGKVLRRVSIGEVPDDHTWGRYPDTTGGWQLTRPTQGQPNQAVFDPDTLVFNEGSVATVDLTLDEQALAALQSSPYEQVPAGLTYTRDGQSVTLPRIGVRLKSGLSFRPITDKPSFRLKFDEFDKEARLHGLRRLTLNNMVQDPSMLHEAVAYRVFREHGVPAARTGHAEVRVNGQPYGLYLILETYDQYAMALRFDDTTHLYEGSADLYLGQADTFEVDEGDEDQRDDLERLIEVIHSTETGSWVEQVSEVLDLDAFLALWAVEATLGQGDGYVAAANNYYLHADGQGRFTMLPSGLDRAFGEPLTVGQASSVLAARCAAIPACRARWQAEVDRLTTQTLPRLQLTAWTEELNELLLPHLLADPRRPFTPQEQAAAKDALLAFLARLSSGQP